MAERLGEGQGETAGKGAQSRGRGFPGRWAGPRRGLAGQGAGACSKSQRVAGGPCACACVHVRARARVCALTRWHSLALSVVDRLPSDTDQRQKSELRQTRCLQAAPRGARARPVASWPLGPNLDIVLAVLLPLAGPPRRAEAQSYIVSKTMTGKAARGRSRSRQGASERPQGRFWNKVKKVTKKKGRCSAMRGQQVGVQAGSWGYNLEPVMVWHPLPGRSEGLVASVRHAQHHSGPQWQLVAAIVPELSLPGTGRVTSMLSAGEAQGHGDKPHGDPVPQPAGQWLPEILPTPSPRWAQAKRPGLLLGFQDSPSPLGWGSPHSLWPQLGLMWKSLSWVAEHQRKFPDRDQSQC